uniref:uncharacterized protein isoform X1 n=1 Tax=Myxine glutinosa TaxID=7769 RepID=UPI00358EA03A
MDAAMEEVLALLGSPQKLERERGLAELAAALSPAEAGAVELVSRRLLARLGDAGWESRQGALLGLKTLLLQLRPMQNMEIDWADLVGHLQEMALELLTDSECRVRLAAGEVLGALCECMGSTVFEACRDKIMHLVHSNLERSPTCDMDELEPEETQQLVDKLVCSRLDRGPEEVQQYAHAAQIFHDTAGWKFLETSMKCLQCMIVGLGVKFNPMITQDMLDLLFAVLGHTNRFVRETGCYVCSSLVSCGCIHGEDGRALLLNEGNAILLHGEQFSQHLSSALADNWSQVRLAASIATRNFLQSMPSDEDKERFYPSLLPRMCLNRYYIAEGVRLYSQTTWRMVVGDCGRLLVSRYIDHFVTYYLEASEANNHAVREAACTCIAELATKVDAASVRPHVLKLMESLLLSFEDESWPVRDAACMACGNLVICFPSEMRAHMENLLKLCLKNLEDPIPTVRQGAAATLANLVRGFGQEVLGQLLVTLQEGLRHVDDQEANTERYSGLDKGPAVFGSVKRLRDNDPELHTDQQMFSCGSLAPKMGRHSKMAMGGCSGGHSLKRASQPWELSDGCVYLMSELASISTTTATEIGKLLPILASAATKHHYTQHVNFIENVCRQLPVLAQHVGKRAFKVHLENFLDSIFYGLDCENQLTACAATECLQRLAQIIGPAILRGRVEMYNSRYLKKLDVLLPPTTQAL